jgi:hypothetical protein
MVKLNLLKPKAVFQYDGHAIVRAEYDFLKMLVEDDSPPYGTYLKQTSGPMTQSWIPATCKLKYIPAPPKPPDMDDLDWKYLNDMVNENGQD